MLLLQQVSDWPEVHASGRNGFLLSRMQEKDDVLMGRKPNWEPSFALFQSPLHVYCIGGFFLTKSKVLMAESKDFCITNLIAYDLNS